MPTKWVCIPEVFSREILPLLIMLLRQWRHLFFAATAIRNNFRSNVSLWLTLRFASSSEEPKVERGGSATFLNLARLVDGRMVDAGYDAFPAS